MYFDFEDQRPDTPTIARPLSSREIVMISVIVHLLAVILILVGPHLPFMKAIEAERLQALEAQRLKELEHEKENRQFVFVQPRLDMKAPTPPARADLSDMDRRARTTMRAPKPTNPLPFSRGNTSERVEASAPVEARREAPKQPDPAPPQPNPERGFMMPDPNAIQPPADVARTQPRGPATGVIADAIRNVQKYAQKDQFSNPQGGEDQETAPSIQFDSKGVEFGPWLRRFIAQIRRNWFIPYAAMSMRGRVVVTFNVHKDGRITDVQVIGASPIDAFNRSAANAVLASTPTLALPPEYPDEKAFFTVTFYFNETPPGGSRELPAPAEAHPALP